MGMLHEVLNRVVFGLMIVVGGFAVLSGYSSTYGIPLSANNGSTTTAELNALIGNMSSEVQTAVPDSSDPIDFGWSIASGVWNAIRLLFSLPGLLSTVLMDGLLSQIFFVPPWIYTFVSLFINVTIFVLVVYLVHQRSG